MRHRICFFLLLSLVMVASGAASAKDRLLSGESLGVDSYLNSGNGNYRFSLQGDGNLVLRAQSSGQSLWSTGTHGQGGVRLAMQSDGNLVLRSTSGKAIWSSKTGGSGATRLSMQGDGNLVLYSAKGSPVWSTGTSGGVSVPAPVEPVEPVVPADIAPASVSNTLTTNQTLSANEYLQSTNLAYRFNLQGDGNLVLRAQSTGQSLWSSGTHGKGGVRLTLQGDGNLVLRTSTGSAVWSSQTNGSGAAKLAMQDDGNLVLYTAVGNPVWSTETSTGHTNGGDTGGGTGGGSNGAPDGGTGGNSGGGTASSRGQFSAPSSALYALNSNRQLGFPRHIDTGFGGNGHSETWDGRIFVRTRTDGWFASAFRPERIVRSADGSVRFDQGAFGNSIALELKTEAPDMQHNWLAITPDPAVSGENPYPSNANGSYQASGSYRTYKAMVYHTSLRNNDNDQMGFRRATFIISNANTPDAQLVKADFTSAFSRLRLQNGADFRCIEPSVTMDSLLIVCQGHPDNNGRIDNLVYSWNNARGSATNWTVPKSIASMYFDDRNANVAGLPFRVRFPIAGQPILDAQGNPYARGELVKGAYPWISHDGSELFYQSSRAGMSARRTGTSVVGRWTGGVIRHIDGPINRDRHKTSRLFLSSPGAFTTMWQPYKRIANLAIPYAVHGPAYPIFGSNSQDYMEVGFDDYLDGNYVMYLAMNEQLNRAGDYQVTRTNDTSGNFNNATLVGARFPVEYNGQDELVGRYGQGIYFRNGNYLSVDRNEAWESLAKGSSVEFWIRKISASGTVRLFTMQGGLEVYLRNGTGLTAAAIDTTGRRVELSGGSVSSTGWTHVGFTFDADSRRMALYIDGRRTASSTAAAFGTLRTTGAVRVGPEDSNALLILDEVKVSNVSRRPDELAYSANIGTNKAPSSALASAVPSHLRSLLNVATGISRFSTAAADLGEDLFDDEILSKQRTTACSTCHIAGMAFTDGKLIARGNEPTDAGIRNTPTLFNRLFSTLQGWSGEAGRLDTQALIPISAAHEMNLPLLEAVQRLRSSSSYVGRFQQVYGEQPSADNLAAALASFQALQFAPKSRVDEYREGNRSVLSAAEVRGLDLFEGKARCSGCHAGVNFTDESFRNNGLAPNSDLGRADVTGRDRDYSLFKVPTLRAVASTAPYMHNGSFSTLRAVVEAYNKGAQGVAERDTDIRPLELSAQDISDLTLFLEAL
ncbi:cytochrome c peroxidase [Allohahella sp. A8]|uniref:cytochrome c peroxidase n=1 Tax=Allohahella sp. A8 TaxID=3141461 RepID=UPI003A808737